MSEVITWDEDRLRAVEAVAAGCPDACAVDVVSLIGVIRRQRAAQEKLMAVAACYQFALQALAVADEDDGHDEHEDCPGAVATAALETAQRLATGIERPAAGEPAP